MDVVSITTAADFKERCVCNVTLSRSTALSPQTSRDLVCFVQFDNVNVYYAKDLKSKYKAPTDHCFVLKVSADWLAAYRAGIPILTTRRRTGHA